jgi:CheY-like chemotaxis protein
MRILLVDDDDALLSLLAKELENRGCDVHQSSSGDEAFHVWQRLGPWELVLTDHRLFPGTKIRDGAQLVAAVHGMNPLQAMAIMTADPQDARRKLPKALRHLPVLRKPFKIEQLLRLLRQPVLLLCTVRCTAA